MIMLILAIAFLAKWLDRTRRVKLSYEERVTWFVNNYYETGMEYQSMLSTMLDWDLDRVQWYGHIIKIPKYRDEI